jgi:hypothetical protein
VKGSVWILLKPITGSLYFCDGTADDFDPGIESLQHLLS